MAESHNSLTGHATSVASDAVGGVAEKTKNWTESITGGPARFQIIFALACILALDSADKATVSAVTGSIESVFNVGNAAIGLLIAVVSFAGSIGTLPAGSMIDRINRRRLLIFAVIIWSIAEAVSGISPSYEFLLITRIPLGLIVAAAFPAVASLTGDYFPARDRSRVYGLILAGELVGTGVGFFISGEVSAWIGWRTPFFIMAALGLVVALEIWYFLPEPARGGQSWISVGQEEIRTKKDVEEGTGPEPPEAAKNEQSGGAAKAQQAVTERGVKPREDLVLGGKPEERSLLWAIRYVLRIPTYALLILATALTYFFFSGVRGFGMVYMTGHYDVSRSAMSALAVIIGLGGLAGIILGGVISQWLLDRKWLTARILVPGITIFVSVLFFAPAIYFRNLWIGMPLLTGGAFMLAAANPPIDAARLDIMHPRLWGRAEAGSMALRGIAEGGAPLLFGVVSEWLGGGVSGLEWTFLVMLVPVLIASSLAIPARLTYPRDVATAAKSQKETSKDQEDKTS